MRAETIYIITWGSDTEPTRAAAGLYRKFGMRAANAAVVNIGEKTTHTVANMKKGKVALGQQIKDKSNSNFTEAWRVVKPPGDESAPQPVETDFKVGVYFVVHGTTNMCWDPSPAAMVTAMQKVIPKDIFGNIGRISLVKCGAIYDEHEANSKPISQALTESPDSSFLQFLKLLADAGCRPQVAAWDNVVTASPGPNADSPLPDIGSKFVQPGREDVWKRGKDYREQHKKVFQLRHDDVVIAGSPSTFPRSAIKN